jgi:uncharacterized protein YqgC (DUF456 family)
MENILLLILGIILLLIGIAGCILPAIPGPPVSFIGMIVLRFTDYVDPGRLKNYDDLLWIFAFVTIVVTILDYIVPVWGTKKFGGSKAGTWGAAIGVIIGLFFAPWGLIIGPFLGAFLAERMSGKDDRASLKAGFGSMVGFVFGVAMKLSASFLMTFYFFREVFR